MITILFAAICTFLIICVLIYPMIDTQKYYVSVYNDEFVVFVESKTILYVNVIYANGEKGKISLLSFVHIFDI